MRILMLHNRYLVPGGEDQSTAAEVALLQEAGCTVDLLEQDNREIEQFSRARIAVIAAGIIAAEAPSSGANAPDP